MQALISLEKTHSFEIRNSHFDEPSPTSVLDALLEDRNEKSASSSESAITAKQGNTLPCLSCDNFLPIWHVNCSYLYRHKTAGYSGRVSVSTNKVYLIFVGRP